MGKALCKDARLCSGGGATEIELAQQLHSHGEACAGLEQYAIKAYARALEVFPRTLAENSGQKPSEIVSTLYNEHKQGHKHVGVNIDGGVIDHSATACSTATPPRSPPCGSPTTPRSRS